MLETISTRISKRYQRERKRWARRWLLAKLPQHAVCAEIGVWEGKFSQKIFDHTHPKKLHLIDPWAYQPSERYQKSFYGSEQSGGQENMDRRYESVKSQFASQIANGSVVINRQDSAKAAAEFPDGYFDWVYVDGNHLYEFVKEDLNAFLPKVRSGGFLCGDDYHERDTWYKAGVKRAVDEFVAEGRAKPVFLRGDQFILRV